MQTVCWLSKLPKMQPAARALPSTPLCNQGACCRTFKLRQTIAFLAGAVKTTSMQAVIHTVMWDSHYCVSLCTQLLTTEP